MICSIIAISKGSTLHIYEFIILLQMRYYCFGVYGNKIMFKSETSIVHSIDYQLRMVHYIDLLLTLIILLLFRHIFV